MPSLQATFSATLPTHEKQAVALSSVAAAAVLTGLKIVVGLLTGSLGILSESAHSALDFLAALVTYIFVRWADRPADKSHPFGHGKFEHVSAFIETSLLLATCFFIVLEACRRLFLREVHVEPTVWAFGVMLLSMAVDAFRSRALSRVARKYNSQALEADALHFSTDIYSSGVVIVGLALVSMARRRGLAWLENADPIAALVVAAIVVYISARLAKRTLDALVDAAPEGTYDRIEKVVAAIPGVLKQDRIRVRQSGNRLFTDLKLTLESNIPFEHAQSVMRSVESRIHELFPTADVVVHATPREPAESDFAERVRAIAHRHNFQVHDVTAYKVSGSVNVNLDLELDPVLRLDEAHDRASKLEREIKEALPGVSEVNVHIEPLLKGVETAQAARSVRSDMEQKLLTIARETAGVLDCHSMEAHQVGRNVLVSMHCTLAPHLSVARVHEITEELELRFRNEFPQISKVSIHPEPKGS
jgi:cation diffusion facilitator family transporter